ncbi:hypothetical protein HNV08_08325 [Winogradskyella eckloniae]|uniref:DUF6688 domain-containing protein n=1 Tax=Winogradskyella eckloniae TaxID=1089306 RepID=UPI00156465BC|nr:DUF6688 family protein [Winogradskyella eckloniae]NRD20052.1 hypothetical protein [Winogradskyella eckloniae]
MLTLPVFIFIVVIFSLVVFNFIFYLSKGRLKTREKLFKPIQLWTVVFVPLLFILMFDFLEANDCCTDSAVFSPEHRIGIYALLIAYTTFYCISIFRKSILPPVVEVFTNSFLILGLVINILLCIHLNTIDLGFVFWGLGNVPIILLLYIELIKNHKILRDHIHEHQLNSNSVIGKVSWSILQLQPLYKYTVFTLILIPILSVLSLFLLLFGQKPDSLIKAFTETYKHGFSQLDYMCDNVECGGHFLCSVGANGHKSIVKPMRYGERNGNKIICNRQLLISNAFEELVQNKWPRVHKFIRSQYNIVGHFIHKYYNIFNIKLVSDMVYLLMKPLELFFLFVLYTFDKHPENRIAIQYLKHSDRQRLQALKIKSVSK